MARRETRRKKKGGIGTAISTLVLLIAVVVFCFAAWRLVHIYLDYKTGVDEYASLEQYVGDQKVTEGLDDSMDANDKMGDEWGDADLSEYGTGSRFETMENPGWNQHPTGDFHSVVCHFTAMSFCQDVRTG